MFCVGKSQECLLLRRMPYGLLRGSTFLLLFCYGSKGIWSILNHRVQKVAKPILISKSPHDLPLINHQTPKNLVKYEFVFTTHVNLKTDIPLPLSTGLSPNFQLINKTELSTTHNKIYKAAQTGRLMLRLYRFT